MKASMTMIFWISAGLFAVSLTQPCFCTVTGCGNSFAVFFSGLFGVFYGGAALTWLANPLLLLSWIFIRKRPVLSFYTSLAALLISLCFLLFTVIINDEAGDYSAITGYGSGYWLWVSSTGVMFAGCLIRRLRGGDQLTGISLHQL